MSIYKAKTYFNSNCKYELDRDIIRSVELNRNDTKSLMRYASKKEERPCEHVVFHDCLQKHDDHFDIAINPKLLAYWK